MSVDADKSSSKGSNWETLRVVIHALILALIVRVFLFQPFNIPSGSMIPTLLIGDYLFVSKYTYGYSRYSFPFGFDLFSGRIWAAEPERGDVVVFKLPRDNETDYIKRVIGLAGRRDSDGRRRARRSTAMPWTRTRSTTLYYLARRRPKSNFYALHGDTSERC